VALNTPSDGQLFTYPTDISINATASQFDNAISKVDLFSDGQNIFEIISSPYSFDLTGAAAGDHVLSATATDSAGVAGNSASVVVTELKGGGSLTATIANPTDVDLSAGTSDWIHWGNADTPENVERKAGITPQISDFTTLSNGDYFVFDLTGPLLVKIFT
jgi:chitinase